MLETHPSLSVLTFIIRQAESVGPVSDYGQEHSDFILETHSKCSCSGDSSSILLNYSVFYPHWWYRQHHCEGEMRDQVCLSGTTHWIHTPWAALNVF